MKLLSHLVFGLASLVMSSAITSSQAWAQGPPATIDAGQNGPTQNGQAPAPAALPRPNNSIDAPMPLLGNIPPTNQLQQLPEPNPLAKPVPFTVRVKDITSVDGHRSHQVTGVGMVVGLKGTGGKGVTTQQLAKSFFRNYGILIEQTPTSSLSAVIVTAEIPPFHRPGEKIIATVAIADDATSLFGGQLLTTPLNGQDGQVYAVAQGALEIGGFSVAGQGASLRKNHDMVGKVEAQIEVAICDDQAFDQGSFRLNLRNKDFTTAFRIANEINKYFPRAAQAENGGSVDVLIPQAFARKPVDFLVMVHNLRVEPDNSARVVINEKTGTIIVGKNVRLSSFMFAKDNLVIATSETPIASQPAPFSEGDTVVLPRTQLQAVETGSRYNLLPANATVGDLANMLNLLGVTPQDIISVFLALHQEGSLHAELVIE